MVAAGVEVNNWGFCQLSSLAVKVESFFYFASILAATSTGQAFDTK